MPIDRRAFVASVLALLTQDQKAAEPAKQTRPGEGDAAILAALKGVEGAKELPGLTAAIAEPGKPTRVGAIGVRKLGSPEPFGAGDLVHLGSCTKAMTATMIATLVEEGKLSWKSTMAEVFPDVEMKGDLRGVSLTQLLTHRSGLPANALWGLFDRSKPTMVQRREVLKSAVKSPLKDGPGSKMTYSNLGYVLAGLMAETVTGRSWEDLMRERLFSPLGMTSAGFGPPGTKGKVEQPWGHARSLGKLQASQDDNPPVLGPAGTVHCTMADWAKFAELHLRGARGEKTAILKPETFRELQTPATGEDYAKGWVVLERDWAGGTALMHNGSNTMWYSLLWLAPKKNVAFLAVANQGGDDAPKVTDRAIGSMIGVWKGQAKP